MGGSNAEKNLDDGTFVISKFLRAPILFEAASSPSRSIASHNLAEVAGMAAARQPPFVLTCKVYQWPVLGIDDQGSAGGFGSPFCSSSIECRSGERTNAMLPSRGGRLMVMPAFIRRSQVA